MKANGGNNPFGSMINLSELDLFSNAGELLSYDGANNIIATGLTTKGDILTRDTGYNRLPVGTDAQILTADSAQALGIKWGNAYDTSVAFLKRTTLGAAATSISLQNIPTCRTLYLRIRALRTASGLNSAALTLNNDTGANYSYRREENGAADSTNTGMTSIPLEDALTFAGIFSSIEMNNDSSFTKLVQAKTACVVTTGAPSKDFTFAQWNSTSQVTRADITFNLAVDIGSYIEAYGCNL